MLVLINLKIGRLGRRRLTLVRPIIFKKNVFGANPLLWEILNVEPEWQVWYPAGLDLGQLGRALQWTPKLGFNLPPTVRQWIRVWRKHAPRLPFCRISLAFFRRRFFHLATPYIPAPLSSPVSKSSCLVFDALNWVVLHLHYFSIEFSAAGTTSASVWGFCYFVWALWGERRRGGGEEIEEFLWSRKLGNMAKRGLMEQDLSKLDVTILHPLSPEVISRQATINIGNSFPVFSSLFFSVFVFFAPRVFPLSFFSEFPLIP